MPLLVPKGNSFAKHLRALVRSLTVKDPDEIYCEAHYKTAPP